MKNPDKIDLDKSQADALVVRLESNSLTDSDRHIIGIIIQCYLWLQSALLESKISISRIKAMFGFKKTESCKNLETELEKSSDDDTDADILALRSGDLPPVIWMADALSSNFTGDFIEYACKFLLNSTKREVISRTFLNVILNISYYTSK